MEKEEDLPMRKEIKIALPIYKVLYSAAFFVILSLVRTVVYADEIGIAMEAPASALAAVFCADTYLMEIHSRRRGVFRLYDEKRQARAVRRRLAAQILYLTALSALGYAMFYWQKPYDPVNAGLSETALFGISIAAIAGSIFFWGVLSMTVCNLFRNQWAGIGAALVLWTVLSSRAGDRMLGNWNAFSFTFRTIEEGMDFGWLYGKSLTILAAAVLLAMVPYILKKRG